MSWLILALALAILAGAALAWRLHEELQENELLRERVDELFNENVNHLRELFKD